MQKIYFNNRLIGVSNDLETCAKRLNSVVYKITNNFDIAEIIRQFLENEQLQELWLYTENTEDVFDKLRSQFRIIDAAGGVVRNNRGELLMIFRNNHWDLPKGKRDNGENIGETALREVEEECSIGELNLFDLIDTTYHTYHEQGEIVLKATHWFAMTHRGNTQPSPQAIEGIEKAEWTPVEKLNEYAESLFPSIREILYKAGWLNNG